MKKLILTLALLLLPSLATAQLQTIHLNTGNTVNFRNEVSDESTAEAILHLIELDKIRGNANYPIYLVLDTPGGSVEAGEDFINFAKTIKNIDTVSLFSASMGSAIMQGLPGKRYVTPGAKIMFHRAKGRFQGQFEDGEVESQLSLWKKIVRSMEIRNAARIGLTLDAYKAKVVNEWWLLGDESVTEKVADATVNITCSKPLIDKLEIKETLSIFGSIKMSFSACPLIRVPLQFNQEEGE